jgi:homocysteine S-methyltransferase
VITDVGRTAGTPVSIGERVAAGPMVIDGGLATLLEAHGHDLSSELWSARLLAEQPAAITAAHREYFEAGAQVAITSSYQASFEGFARLGLDRVQSAELLRRSVRLARQAADTAAPADDSPPADRWVAASVGPYGAALADGSEYRGDYGMTVAQLRAWHRPRLEILAESGADLLAVETIPCLAEVEALLEEISDLEVSAWLSLTCAGGRTRAGEPAAEAFAMAGGVEQVVAVGVNCVDAIEATDLVSTAAESSSKPAVVYPNSGESWDATTRSWAGTATFGPEHAAVWVAAGARLVGGCCRVGPTAIRQLARFAPGWPVGDPGSVSSR